jgi:hypothetical protein
VAELSCADRVPSRWTAICSSDVDALVLLRTDFLRWLWRHDAFKQLALERDDLYARRAMRGIKSMLAFTPDTNKQKNIALHELKHIQPALATTMPAASLPSNARRIPAAPTSFKLVGGPQAAPVGGPRT